jgi:hypothetical protein
VEDVVEILLLAVRLLSTLDPPEVLLPRLRTNRDGETLTLTKPRYCLIMTSDMKRCLLSTSCRQMSVAYTGSVWKSSSVVV